MTENTRRCRERFTIKGYLVTVVEEIRRDGGGHLFHVVLHARDVLLPPSPWTYMPDTREIEAAIMHYRDNATAEADQFGALIAAARYVCTELEALSKEGAQTIPTAFLRWVETIRTNLALEMAAY